MFLVAEEVDHLVPQRERGIGSAPVGVGLSESLAWRFAPKNFARGAVPSCKGARDAVGEELSGRMGGT